MSCFPCFLLALFPGPQIRGAAFKARVKGRHAEQVGEGLEGWSGVEKGS